MNASEDIPENIIVENLAAFSPLKNLIYQHDELKLICRRLLNAKEGAIITVAGPSNLSGCGKTTFLSTAIRSDEVRRGFSGGIIWIKVGDIQRDIELIDVVRSITHKLLTRSLKLKKINLNLYHKYLQNMSGYNHTSIDGFVNIMNEIIAYNNNNDDEKSKSNILLVLDDVWNDKIIRIFKRLKVVIAITTRRPELFSEGQFHGTVFYLNPLNLEQIYHAFHTKQTISSIESNQNLAYLVLKSTIGEISILAKLSTKYKIYNFEKYLQHIKDNLFFNIYHSEAYSSCLVYYQQASINVGKDTAGMVDIPSHCCHDDTSMPLPYDHRDNKRATSIHGNGVVFPTGYRTSQIFTKKNIDENINLICTLHLMFSDMSNKMKYRYMQLVLFPVEIYLNKAILSFIWELDHLEFLDNNNTDNTVRYNEFEDTLEEFVYRGLLLCYQSPSLLPCYYLAHAHVEYLTLLHIGIRDQCDALMLPFYVRQSSGILSAISGLFHPPPRPSPKSSSVSTSFTSPYPPTFTSNKDNNEDEDEDVVKINKVLEGEKNQGIEHSEGETNLLDISPSTILRASTIERYLKCLTDTSSCDINTCFVEEVLKNGCNHAKHVKLWNHFKYLCHLNILTPDILRQSITQSYISHGLQPSFQRYNNYVSSNIAHYYQAHIDFLIQKRDIESISTHIYDICCIVDAVENVTYESRDMHLLLASWYKTVLDFMKYSTQNASKETLPSKNEHHRQDGDSLSHQELSDTSITLRLKEAMIRNKLGQLYSRLGKYSSSLECHYTALQLYQGMRSSSISPTQIEIACTFCYIADAYVSLTKYSDALYLLKSVFIFLTNLLHNTSSYLDRDVCYVLDPTSSSSSTSEHVSPSMEQHVIMSTSTIELQLARSEEKMGSLLWIMKSSPMPLPASDASEGEGSVLRSVKGGMNGNIERHKIIKEFDSSYHTNCLEEVILLYTSAVAKYEKLYPSGHSELYIASGMLGKFYVLNGEISKGIKMLSLSISWLKRHEYQNNGNIIESLLDGLSHEYRAEFVVSKKVSTSWWMGLLVCGEV